MLLYSTFWCVRSPDFHRHKPHSSYSNSRPVNVIRVMTICSQVINAWTRQTDLARGRSHAVNNQQTANDVKIMTTTRKAKHHLKRIRKTYVYRFIFSFYLFLTVSSTKKCLGEWTLWYCCISRKFSGYRYARQASVDMDISMDIHGYTHGYPRKICGYGYGYGWQISYPRQAWIFGF